MSLGGWMKMVGPWESCRVAQEYSSPYFAKEDSDDNLENENWDDPRHYIFSLSCILEEDEEDLDVGDGGVKSINKCSLYKPPEYLQK